MKLYTYLHISTPFTRKDTQTHQTITHKHSIKYTFRFTHYPIILHPIKNSNPVDPKITLSICNFTLNHHYQQLSPSYDGISGIRLKEMSVIVPVGFFDFPLSPRRAIKVLLRRVNRSRVLRWFITCE